MTGNAAINDIAAGVGARLLAQFRDELNIIKNPANDRQSVWSVLSVLEQDEVLDRLKRRLRSELELAFAEILANDRPAVHATLAKVVFTDKGIQGALQISKASQHRHALADFSGHQVLVILAEDLSDYLDSMDLIEPDKPQQELGLAETEEGPDQVEIDDQDDAVDEEHQDDPRSNEELAAEVGRLAIEIGEPDVTAEDAAGWSRQHLLNYLEYADKQLAAKEAAN